jgi:PPM family protein phosphatase
MRRLGGVLIALIAAGLLGSAAYLALQSVYFVGTNERGLVTMFSGVPYRLPGNLALYSSSYVSGVSAASLTPARRHTLLSHSLRSEADAASLIRSLELGELE